MDSDATLVGSAGSLWQYPGKSMLGHDVARLDIGRTIRGDHEIAVINDGEVITAKQSVGVPLLRVKAWALPLRGGRSRYRLRITDAMGGYHDGDSNDPFMWTQLSRLLGIPVRVVRVGAEPRPERRIDGRPVRSDSFVDEVDVHLVTTASVRAVEQAADVDNVIQRMRPQVVIDPAPGIPALAEREWVGRKLRIGDQVELRLDNLTRRCALPGRPQLDMEAAPGLLKYLKVNHDNRFGVSATIVQPGTICVGDPVRVVRLT